MVECKLITVEILMTSDNMQVGMRKVRKRFYNARIKSVEPSSEEDRLAFIKKDGFFTPLTNIETLEYLLKCLGTRIREEAE